MAEKSHISHVLRKSIVSDDKPNPVARDLIDRGGRQPSAPFGPPVGASAWRAGSGQRHGGEPWLERVLDDPNLLGGAATASHHE
jgi:hypothetical protein